MKFLHIASDSEVKEGSTTDIYFVRTLEILKSKGLDNRRVVMELTPGKLPEKWNWGVLTGTTEFLKLLEGLMVDVHVMDEGTVFREKDDFQIRLPIAYIEGKYVDFCIYETPSLGLLCQSSGVSTAAAHVRTKAWKALLVAFGARRMHPAICPMLDWATYVGGFDAVSTIKGAEVIGEKPVGTMPHSLILVYGDPIEAWKAFDEVIDPIVSRIMLVDTFYDEKIESIMAAETLKDRLDGVRLDTPSSRRGNMEEIVKEVRWELDLRGYKDVKIVVSGGIDDKNIGPLMEAGAEAFGVGTSVSNAPTIDFAADIVEVDGNPFVKRGKLSGRKQVWRCRRCYTYKVTLEDSGMPNCWKCGGETDPLLNMAIVDGKKVREIPTANTARSYVLKQLESMKAAWGES